MNSKKIRGLKRRQKELNKWIELNSNLDVNRLKKYQYDYAKVKFGPWENLFKTEEFPTDYRNQLFSSLLNFYSNWKNELDKNFDNYYLKIWLYYPRFKNSQIVAAIGNKIKHYESNFEKSDLIKEFPKQEFKNENERILKFDWELNNDYDYYSENDNYDHKFYKNLMKRKTPFNLIENENGENEKVFLKQKGYIWIGEKKI